MSGVGNIGSALSAATGTGSSGSSGELSAEEFMNILIAEVQNQNPLEPMKNNELMAQMTQIKSLQATAALTEQLGKLSTGMELGSAASLIGKLVVGHAANGSVVTGKVGGLIIENDAVNLVVEGYPLLPLSNVEEVVGEAVEEETDDGS